MEILLTNGSRGTANARHFYHALVCVFTVLYGKFVKRWLPLNRALAGKLKEQFYSGFVVRALHLKFRV
ncbi:hypothetical protein, partial [Vibrio diazotrophicus]|uniref:hypothetical protein n=1 Tax=Vibrio diazotrophicus TaxID=685 RepID=UPI0020CA869C